MANKDHLSICFCSVIFIVLFHHFNIFYQCFCYLLCLSKLIYPGVGDCELSIKTLCVGIMCSLHIETAPSWFESAVFSCLVYHADHRILKNPKCNSNVIMEYSSCKWALPHSPPMHAYQLMFAGKQNLWTSVHFQLFFPHCSDSTQRCDLNMLGVVNQSVQVGRSDHEICHLRPSDGNAIFSWVIHSVDNKPALSCDYGCDLFVQYQVKN